MFHDGVRCCDLCSSWILGSVGADICSICHLSDEEGDYLLNTENGTGLSPSLPTPGLRFPVLEAC